MTSLSRKRELARSIEQQVRGSGQQSSIAHGLVHLLLEYVDRAEGFARLESVPYDEFAETDHIALVALASRALLAELKAYAAEANMIASTLPRFRAALGSALLTPDAGTLAELRQRASELASALGHANGQ